MGYKLEQAYAAILAESRHHTRLAQARDTDYDKGFAQGFAEAFRIVAAIREGKGHVYVTPPE